MQRLVFPGIALFFLAGCASTAPAPEARPQNPEAPRAATVPPVTAKAAVPPAAPTTAAAPATEPVALEEAPAVKTPPAAANFSAEVEAVVAHFTQGVGGNPLHELSGSTGFPSALASLQSGMIPPEITASTDPSLPPPRGLTADGNSTELIDRDWTGLVLVPVNTALSKAYTSQVRLLRVEAHPLYDGRLRIWTRVRNISNSRLPAEIACAFRMRGETTSDTPYFYQLDVPPGEYRDVFFVSPDGELSTYIVLVRSEEVWRNR